MKTFFSFKSDTQALIQKMLDTEYPLSTKLYLREYSPRKQELRVEETSAPPRSLWHRAQWPGRRASPCPPVGERVQKMWGLHAMQYGSADKRYAG